MERDYFLSPKDALDFGIIDEIITKRQPDQSSSAPSLQTTNIVGNKS